MFEGTQSETLSDTTKFIFALITLVASNFGTWFFTRPKTNSDIVKNAADAHKSEADAMRTNVSTIVALNDELGDVLTQMRGLKKEVGELEELRDTLEDTIEAINNGFKSEKSLIAIIVDKAISDLNDVVNGLISRDIQQSFRMSLVSILETLYRIKRKLTD